MIRKLLCVTMLFLFTITINCYPANKWMEGDGSDAVEGTDNVSDLDTLITASLQDPLDRLLSTYINGVTLTYTDSNTITVGTGEIVCSDGSVQRFRKNTATFTIDLSANSVTAGVDVVGDVDKASSWFHIYANADADATTFTGCASTSSSNPTGVTYYKYIGSVYNDSGQDLDVWYWAGDGNDVTVMWDVPVQVTNTPNNGWSGATSVRAPFSSVLGIFGLTATETAAGTQAEVYIRPNGSNWPASVENGIYVYDTNSGTIQSGGQRWCMMDSSQQIQYNSTGANSMTIDIEGYVFQR